MSGEKPALPSLFDSDQIGNANTPAAGFATSSLPPSATQVPVTPENKSPCVGL